MEWGTLFSDKHMWVLGESEWTGKNRTWFNPCAPTKNSPERICQWHALWETILMNFQGNWVKSGEINCGFDPVWAMLTKIQFSCAAIQNPFTNWPAFHVWFCIMQDSAIVKGSHCCNWGAYGSKNINVWYASPADIWTCPHCLLEESSPILHMYPFKAVFQYFFLCGCLVRELRSYLRPLVQVQGLGVSQVVSSHGETLTRQCPCCTPIGHISGAIHLPTIVYDSSRGTGFRPMTHHDPSPRSNCTQAAERYGHPLVGSCYHYDPSGGNIHQLQYR